MMTEVLPRALRYWVNSLPDPNCALFGNTLDELVDGQVLLR